MSAPLPTPDGMEAARTVAARLWSDPPAVEDKIAAEIRDRDAQWQRHLADEREARAKAEAEVAKLREALSQAEGSARSCAEGARKHGRRALEAARERDAALAIVACVHGADILPSKLTHERIEAALRRAREGTTDLEESLRDVFGDG